MFTLLSCSMKLTSIYLPMSCSHVYIAVMLHQTYQYLPSHVMWSCLHCCHAPWNLPVFTFPCHVVMFTLLSCSMKLTSIYLPMSCGHVYIAVVLHETYQYLPSHVMWSCLHCCHAPWNLPVFTFPCHVVMFTLLSCSMKLTSIYLPMSCGHVYIAVVLHETYQYLPSHVMWSCLHCCHAPWNLPVFTFPCHVVMFTLLSCSMKLTSIYLPMSCGHVYIAVVLHETYQYLPSHVMWSCLHCCRAPWDLPVFTFPCHVVMFTLLSCSMKLTSIYLPMSCSHVYIAVMLHETYQYLPPHVMWSCLHCCRAPWNLPVFTFPCHVVMFTLLSCSMKLNNIRFFNKYIYL